MAPRIMHCTLSGRTKDATRSLAVLCKQSAVTACQHVILAASQRACFTDTVLRPLPGVQDDYEGVPPSFPNPFDQSSMPNPFDNLEHVPFGGGLAPEGEPTRSLL